MVERIGFTRKFFACLTLSLLFLDTVLLLGTPPRPEWISTSFIFGLALLGLIIPLLGLPVWQYREQRNATADSYALFSRIQTGIAWLTGFCISLFGWKKLFHLQFRTPLSIADLPMSSQNGETLTWFYFGHSYTFACIIGTIQITGAFLLFFKRTRLIGAILLFPVMLNILLINIFYQMNAGALVQSILLTLGLLYILLSKYHVFRLLLFPVQRLAGTSGPIKWLALTFVSFVPFLYAWNLGHRLSQSSTIYGCYEVRDLWVNGKPSSAGKDSVLTRIYFDLDNVCVLEYNSPNRRLIANYTFKRIPDAVTINSRFVDNGREVPLSAHIGASSEDELVLKGSLAGDRIYMLLSKLR